MRDLTSPSPIGVESFLKLGYFIDYEANRQPIDFSRIDKGRYTETSGPELVAVGKEALRSTIGEQFQDSNDHVVPLSGGLDSRLILCALLEQTEAKNIRTYTHGIPGSYDFEIGAQLAKEAGTRHISFPMNAMTYHEDDLLDVARREDCQAVLFLNTPSREVERLFGNGTVWSGYVGDAVAGSHLHDPPSATLDQAKRTYLRNRAFVRSTRLHRCSDDAFIPHVAGGRIAPDVLTWDEQVLFDEGVAKFTVAHVIWKGFTYKTPLINSVWMDFMFSVPNRYRLGRQLMIDVGRAISPRLFGLRSTNRIGHDFDTPKAMLKATFWWNRVRKLFHQFAPSVNWPNVQYNDFNEAIRTSPDVRRIVRGAVERLRTRGICDWVDFDGIWQRHERRLRNHGDALIVLASLQLVLEAHAQRTSASRSDAGTAAP